MTVVDLRARPSAATTAPDRAGRAAPAVWSATWETGPDAGGRVGLACGRAIVGRAESAPVRCDDPALEPHHALLVVEADVVRLVQLTGRAPLVVDGTPVDGATCVTDGAVVELGQSTLRLHRSSTDPPAAAHIRGGAVLRTPRSVPRWEDPAPSPPPVAAAAEPGRPVGLVSALCAAAGALVVAAVLGQWMFAAVGVLGAAVAAGGWVAQRVGSGRRQRRGRRGAERAWAAHAEAVAASRAAYAAHLAATSSTAVTAVATITARDHRLWSRRAGDDDAFVVTLGRGDVAWPVPVASAAHDGPLLHLARHRDPPAAPVIASVLHDQPVTVPLGPGHRLAVRGAPHWTAAACRALLLQLAADCGPSDLRLLVATEDTAPWSWLTALPQATAPDGAPLVTTPADLAATLALLDQAATPHVVIVTDAPALLAARTATLRRAVTGERRPALVVLLTADEPTPPLCTAELCCPSSNPSTGAWARWSAELGNDEVPASVRLAGIGERVARRAAGSLRGLVDPDDPFGPSATLPEQVSLLDLLRSDGRPLTPAGIAARWRSAGVDASPRTPIGIAVDGVVDLDLVRDGPHGLVAGTTGSGKSELLRSLVAGMATNAPPRQLTFVLVDYKGGATFDACAELPHVVGVVTDLDEHLTDRMLRSLQAELRRREAVLRAAGAGDLAAAHRADPELDLPRLVVVIDEFAALVGEQPAFLHALVGIAQRGRSLGVHLLLATQRPGGVLSDDIRANTNIRCALRLTDSSDALDVVGDATPVSFPRRLAGRAVLRLGPDEHVTFHSAHCAPAVDGPGELAQLAQAIREAHQRAGGDPPPRPWCPPLPDQLDADDPRLADELDELGDVDALGSDADGPPTSGVVGLLDDPDRQRQSPVRWRIADGHLLLGGGRRSGVTSTLVALAVATLADRVSHVYVVDARGSDTLAALTAHPGCAAVVRLDEGERLRRLLLRLGDEVDHRHPGDAPPILLVVDGYGELRDRLADTDTTAEREALERIIAHGARRGVVAVLATGQPSAVAPAVLAHCPRRWLHHLADRHEAPAWGFATADVPTAIPGRLAVAPGLLAQIVRVGAPRPPVEPLTRPAPVEVLPACVDAGMLSRGRTDGEVGVLLPVGLGFDTGATVELDVPDGEHALILGPARSGRSTTLRRIVAAWQEAHPAGWSAILAPRDRTVGRGALTDVLRAMPAAGAVLLAVDDADLVADTDPPTLAALAASRRPGLLIVAAGTAEGLRQSYGHWTGVVRRSRLGLVMAASNDLDGDLLAATVPRRRPIGARPGLAWLIGRGEVRLVQVAGDRRPGDDRHG